MGWIPSLKAVIMFLALISPSFCVIGPIIDLNWAEFKTLESDSPSRVNRQKIGAEQELEIGTNFFFGPRWERLMDSTSSFFFCLHSRIGNCEYPRSKNFLRLRLTETWSFEENLPFFVLNGILVNVAPSDINKSLDGCTYPRWKMTCFDH